MHAYVLRRPEPQPFFDCSRAGGYRICACGHHYYDHTNVVHSPDIVVSPESDPLLRDMVDTYGREMDKVPSRADKKPIVIRTGRSRRRWYWPF